MTAKTKLYLAGLVGVVAGVIALDSMVFHTVLNESTDLLGQEAPMILEMVAFHSVMIGILSLVMMLVFHSQSLEEDAKNNPLVIEIMENTLIGRWDNKKDILIGAPFSADEELVSKSDILVKGINQIIDTIRKEKGGSKAHLFVALCPKMPENKALSESQRSLLSQVIEQSGISRGAIFQK